MKIKLIGNTSGLLAGVNYLSEDLNFTIANDGYPILVVNRPGPIEIKVSNGQGEFFLKKNPFL